MEIENTKTIKHMDLEEGNLFMTVEPVVHTGCGKRGKKFLYRRSWMIHSFFKCLIIGTCLSLEEQKKILKKTGYPIKNRTSYEIHATFVYSLSDKNKLSKRVDAYLNKKFKNEISKFFSLDRSLFLDAWEKHFRKGEIDALLWVAAIRTDLDKEDIKSIFGEMHMQMHLNAGQNLNLKRRLFYQDGKNQQLVQKLKNLTLIRKKLKKQNEILEKDQTELHKKYTLLENELSTLRKKRGIFKVEAENQQLQNKLEDLSGKTGHYQQRINDLKRQNNQLLSKFESQCEINNHLRKETREIVTRFSSLTKCDAKCPLFDLCRKRVLIVGGITKIKEHYKKLIEENGGIFEYHNGYTKGGAKILKSQVKRADVVLCSVSCNSHSACLAVKKIGKKYSKQVHMLAGSGLSAISQALKTAEEINQNTPACTIRHSVSSGEICPIKANYN